MLVMIRLQSLKCPKQPSIVLKKKYCMLYIRLLIDSLTSPLISMNEPICFVRIVEDDEKCKIELGIQNE